MLFFMNRFLIFLLLIAPLVAQEQTPLPATSPSAVEKAPEPLKEPATSLQQPASSTATTTTNLSSSNAPTDAAALSAPAPSSASAVVNKKLSLPIPIQAPLSSAQKIPTSDRAPVSQQSIVVPPLDNNDDEELPPRPSIQPSNKVIVSKGPALEIPSTKPPAALDDKIKIQFPHTSIQEVLALYEKLTGKRIIRDSNLTGPDLSVMIADPVSKKEAISILESSMLLNGYTLVPSDEKTLKILGPNRPPRTEGVPFFIEESALPIDGDKLVSFYQPLHFLTPNEAINILQGVVQLNPFGSLVAVPNTSALVITDKTPIVRKALAILEVIDHEPSQIITEFIQLRRADAEKTADLLSQMFGKENTGISSKPASASSGVPGGPGGPGSLGKQGQPAAPVASSDSSEEEHVVSGKVQFIADKRTNRILLVTRAENYRYVRELIDKLDQAQQPEEPLVRQLNYMSVTDVFPVLVQMLKNKDDDSANTTTGTNSPTASPFKNANGSATGGGGLMGSSGSTDSTGNPTGSSTGTMGGAGSGDRLNETAPTAPPQSAVIGSTSLVADPTANSIIVYGPPESKAKARQIIDLLDRRPQQVYLAAVIGEMDLGNNMDYGAAYLFHYQGFNTLFSGGVNQLVPNGGTIPIGAGATAANALAQGAGGLTVFGAIGGSLDAYANFLESTHKFRTISRPVVYTSNNRKATIFSGQRIPYQSSTLSSVVNANTANNTANSITSNISYQDVLLKLEVIPLINSDKEVNLIIAQQNQTVDTAATAVAVKQQVNAPVINTQELTTSVRIPSGSTIVLGGLIQDIKDVDKSGIPYLDRIPVIGPLFGGHTTQSRTRKELVIMIQPVVIDSNIAMKKASAEEGGKSDVGLKAQNLKYQLQPPPPPPKKKGFQLFALPKADSF